MARNPWWFRPKLYIVVLWAAFIARSAYPSQITSALVWFWIGYGLMVALLCMRIRVQVRHGSGRIAY